MLLLCDTDAVLLSSFSYQTVKDKSKHRHFRPVLIPDFSKQLFFLFLLYVHLLICKCRNIRPSSSNLCCNISPRQCLQQTTYGYAKEMRIRLDSRWPRRRAGALIPLRRGRDKSADTGSERLLSAKTGSSGASIEDLQGTSCLMAVLKNPIILNKLIRKVNNFRVYEKGWINPLQFILFICNTL